ncbi:hypothetical protein MATR_08200 [Marivirga tractuosa]|uniref:Lipoprotein n=1 Tax=Marivirga tractuosa (strain ATCC 23168 / DSM 4126 / NBRC 15989 / NCIMB 1408 / VKM B-1430 / H-43) TaxID=643867 RepID=E4TPG2_MARTH|nr:hypothetical protein [Marivirga tractuosa]ADR21550.1 hypothetical protein Ftrac_1560 [Marivirga tractuosa DSM 4126]BDD13995.1 hypothetical protein MATR_08200 [Marivirga tractuosa]
MNTFKNLLIYSVSLIALFSLTAISCEDLSEEVTVDVPTDLTKTFRVSSTETGAFEIVEQVDLASDEIAERREQMKDFTVESFNFAVVDNLEEGSGIPTNLELLFYAGDNRVGTGTGILSGSTFEEQLNSLSSEYVTQLKNAVETYVLDDGTLLEITLEGFADVPMDYTVTFTMEATIEAGVQ